MSGPAKKSSLHRSKDTRKYWKGKEGKTDEIKRALTHRARLRKEYFKILKNEGESVPEKGEDDQLTGEEDPVESREQAPLEDRSERKSPMSYQDRMKINRERKERKRRERLIRTKDAVSKMKRQEKDREHKKEMYKNARTRRGQPLMAPRINDLLEKIKRETTSDKELRS